ncbi:MAG TPA: hypothetical protein VLL76_11400, partial [Candidatus Omnitrophota bacterium]|nr:hypothetical protein [Candidatus Omnitrophota bacterium]
MTKTPLPPLPGNHREAWRRARQAMEADGRRFTRKGRKGAMALAHVIDLACRLDLPRWFRGGVDNARDLRLRHL